MSVGFVVGVDDFSGLTHMHHMAFAGRRAADMVARDARARLSRRVPQELAAARRGRRPRAAARRRPRDVVQVGQGPHGHVRHVRAGRGRTCQEGPRLGADWRVAGLAGRDRRTRRRMVLTSFEPPKKKKSSGVRMLPHSPERVCVHTRGTCVASGRVVPMRIATPMRCATATIDSPKTTRRPQCRAIRDGLGGLGGASAGGLGCIAPLTRRGDFERSMHLLRLYGVRDARERRTGGKEGKFSRSRAVLRGGSVWSARVTRSHHRPHHNTYSPHRARRRVAHRLGLKTAARTSGGCGTRSTRSSSRCCRGSTARPSSSPARRARELVSGLKRPLRAARDALYCRNTSARSLVTTTSWAVALNGSASGEHTRYTIFWAGWCGRGYIKERGVVLVCWLSRVPPNHQKQPIERNSAFLTRVVN